MKQARPGGDHGLVARAIIWQGKGRKDNNVNLDRVKKRDPGLVVEILRIYIGNYEYKCLELDLFHSDTLPQ